MRVVNQAGLDLIKHFEGFRATPYICSGGKRTIGYGHVIQPNERLVNIDREIGEVILKQDVRHFAEHVKALVTVPLNDNQFAALVSFAFNVGAGRLKTSTLLRLLNSGDYEGAADQLPRWRRAGGHVMPGLVRRRKAERELFLRHETLGENDEGHKPARNQYGE